MLELVRAGCTLRFLCAEVAERQTSESQPMLSNSLHFCHFSYRIDEGHWLPAQ